VTVALLAYCSVYQAGYEARATAPGLAAMRIHSHYYIPEWDAYGKVEPGVRPHVRTFPYPEDLAHLNAAIAQAKPSADVVVTSFHWGTASEPAVLMDCERILGHAAINAGADIVFGHHHHDLRGIAFYKRKPIFYGLVHFAFDLPGLDTALSPFEISKLKQMGEHAIYPREGYPFPPFHPDARMTGIAACVMKGASMTGIGLLPCVINRDSQPVPVSADAEAGQRIVDYMQLIGEQAGISTDYGDYGPKIAGLHSISAK
jgi:Bacterial capsule synthesis protein PGA_cap